MVNRYNRVFVACVIAMVIAVFGLVVGCFQYGDMVSHSSSPIGTKMEFARSNASVEISGIYTDETQSCLVVRIKDSSSSGMLNLPYKGTDFRVYVESAAYSAYAGQEVPMLFGRYGTNGDLYLIIPKPTNDVYNIFIQNKNFVATEQVVEGAADDSSSGAALDAGADESYTDEETMQYLREALTQYEYTDIRERSDSLAIKSDLADIIGFRVTLAPAFNTEDYRAKVLPGTLLSDDGDFDFEALFNDLFKDTATYEVSEDYERADEERRLLRQRVTELEERLRANTSDKDVEAKLREVRTKLNSVEADMKAMAEKFQTIENVEYSSSLFSDMNDRALALSTEQSDVLSQAGQQASGKSEG